MNELARTVKNSVIREHGRENRISHTSVRPVVVETKPGLKWPDKAEQEKLWHCPAPAKAEQLCDHEKVKAIAGRHLVRESVYWLLLSHA